MKKTFNLIIGFVLIAIFIIIGVKVLDSIFHAFDRLNISVQTGIATALSVIIVAIVGYFANKSIETKKSIEQAMRPRKLELYEGFITFFLRTMAKEGTPKKPTPEEIGKFFIDSNPTIITFASNSVIEKWGKLRIGMTGSKGTESLFQLEELLKEIRKDLGHGKRGSKKGDILRLFVNDIDTHLGK
jgi:hypothetical protein